MKYRLHQLGALFGAQVIGDGDKLISGVNTLEEALSSDLSFLANPRYQEAMKRSEAGAICIGFDLPPFPGKSFLQAEDPSRLFQKAVELFLKPAESGFCSIHPTAVIHPSASIDESASIGPYAVIDRESVIGPMTEIGPHVSIGPEVKIGSKCKLFAHATVREKCILGNRVILQPGAVIGSCGFGYTTNREGEHLKLEQLGIVILEDDVEIGANTTVARSRFKTTLIRKGTKIDNLVQIAHNVEIGEYNLIAAQTGIAGSSKTGAYVLLGGQVGIVGHVELAPKTRIATRGGVSKSLEEGTYRGSPAIPIAEYNRQEIYIRRLAKYNKKIEELEKKLQQIETSCNKEV